MFPDTLALTCLVLDEVDGATEALSKSLLHASSRKLEKKIQHQDNWRYLAHAIFKMVCELMHSVTVNPTLILYTVFAKGQGNIQEYAATLGSLWLQKWLD